MTESSVKADVIFVGQTGVGKSTLINMVMGVLDSATGAAEVSINAYPCTERATPYATPPITGLQCLLWDTRGLGEAADVHSRGLIAKIADWVRLVTSQGSQQARELKETLRDRTRLATPVLVWCMDAAKIDVETHWQSFRRVYVEYCEKKAIPVIVITQMPQNVEDWEERCTTQLQELTLGEGPNTVNIPLLRVRRYRKTPCDEYNEDSSALRDLISKLTKH